MKIIRPIPPLHQPAQALGLLGRRGGDIGQDEHVGGFQPLGEEIVLLHDLDPPCFRRADAHGQGSGEVVDLGAERLRRGLAVHQANRAVSP